jgi:hypothetical protein
MYKVLPNEGGSEERLIVIYFPDVIFTPVGVNASRVFLCDFSKSVGVFFFVGDYTNKGKMFY